MIPRPAGFGRPWSRPPVHLHRDRRPGHVAQGDGWRAHVGGGGGQVVATVSCRNVRSRAGPRRRVGRMSAAARNSDMISSQSKCPPAKPWDQQDQGRVSGPLDLYVQTNAPGVHVPVLRGGRGGHCVWTYVNIPLSCSPSCCLHDRLEFTDQSPWLPGASTPLMNFTPTRARMATRTNMIRKTTRKHSSGIQLSSSSARRRRRRMSCRPARPRQCREHADGQSRLLRRRRSRSWPARLGADQGGGLGGGVLTQVADAAAATSRLGIHVRQGTDLTCGLKLSLSVNIPLVFLSLHTHSPGEWSFGGKSGLSPDHCARGVPTWWDFTRLRAL